ncbi:hypothetical protein WJX72_008671 [[Myrmecia] bisecta]|uniref:CG-1 domain-containing protein n=1 Tax=[Myrmecia] bisecta TaxID=41462 RepID=A0AAW1PCY4_9CHLO
MAEPLTPTPAHPKSLKEILSKSRTCWLRNTEVCEVLQNYRAYGFQVSKESPVRPAGGTLYLFNRKTNRFFRRDQHVWRKKADGKTVRETHEKLKVGNKDMLNCYYAHAESLDNLQRRCYWLLEGDDNIVLVHYLLAGQAKSVMRAQASMPAQLALQRSGQLTHSGSFPDNYEGDTAPPPGIMQRNIHFTVTTGETSLADMAAQQPYAGHQMHRQERQQQVPIQLPHSPFAMPASAFGDSSAGPQHPAFARAGSIPALPRVRGGGLSASRLPAFEEPGGLYEQGAGRELRGVRSSLDRDGTGVPPPQPRVVRIRLAGIEARQSAPETLANSHTSAEDWHRTALQRSASQPAPQSDNPHFKLLESPPVMGDQDAWHGAPATSSNLMAQLDQVLPSWLDHYASHEGPSVSSPSAADIEALMASAAHMAPMGMEGLGLFKGPEMK